MSNHSHHNHHAHHHTHQTNRRILGVSFAMITAFMLLEFVGGYLFGSLALTADAGHMANDAFSLGLAFVASYSSAKLQNRIAMLNGLSLILVAIYIVFEAYRRIFEPTDFQALPMIAIATAGLLVNIVVAYLMHDHQHENLNLKAAYLHVLADLLGSLAAIISGLFAYFLHWIWVDTAISLLLALFVLKSGIQVIKMAKA